MANHTVEAEVHDHQTDGPSNWQGGTEPFKASYGKLMMWYFLLSDAFTFAGFLIAYGALRVSSPSWPVPDFVFKTAPFFGETKPLMFVTFMTFVLILSSVTMVRAVQEGHRENLRGVTFWMLMTIIGGAAFLGCQAWEWTNLIKVEGMSIYTNPFSAHQIEGKYASAADMEALGFVKGSTEGVGDYYLEKGAADVSENRFYEKSDHHGHSKVGESIALDDPYLITLSHTTHEYEYGAIKTADGNIVQEKLGPKAFGALFFCITGFHGFHVFSGVAFLLIIMINVMGGVYTARKNGYEMVEKIGLYWHFVDLVWVFVFLVFYLL